MIGGLADFVIFCDFGVVWGCLLLDSFVSFAVLLLIYSVGLSVLWLFVFEYSDFIVCLAKLIVF